MRKLLTILLITLAACFQSCENDDLLSEIEDIKNRVSALETQVTTLNGNIVALQALHQSGATITSVKLEDGTYTITQSNGEVITLTQGSDTKIIIPIMAVDENGYWIVSYTGVDGTFEQIKIDGQAVKAAAVTPEMKVDEKGFWLVRYGEDDTFEQVLDTNGDPVSALGTGDGAVDSFFEDVVYDETAGVLNITMVGGKILSIPVVADFYCRIITPTPGLQEIPYGTTVTYKVEIKGVKEYRISVPEGWSASLAIPEVGDTLLSLTAPVSTRAVADTDKDVTISAYDGLYSCIAKIQVEASSTTPPQTSPTATVTKLVTDEMFSLSYNIAIENADSWKYIHQLSSEVAPTAEEIVSDGTTGTGTSLVIYELEHSTDYVLYVVAIKTTINSVLASAGNKTKVVVDYYKMWQNDEEFTVGDIIVNKTNYATANAPIKPSDLESGILQKEGLIFIDNSDPNNLTKTLQHAYLTRSGIIIGQYQLPKQAEITFTGRIFCRANISAFKNIKLIGTYAGQFIETTSTTVDPKLIIEDCSITSTGSIIYDNHISKSFSSIYINNSTIKVTTANKSIISFAIATKGTNSMQVLTKLTLTNNIIYAENSLQFYLLDFGNKNASEDATKAVTTNVDIVIKQNTIYNIYQPNVLIRFIDAKSMDVSENVTYFNSTINKKNYLTAIYDLAMTTATVSKNYLYTEAITDTHFWSERHTGEYAAGVTENIKGVTATNPFSSENVANGYFPINTTTVTNGAGADYDNKYWINQE